MPYNAQLASAPHETMRGQTAAALLLVADIYDYAPRSRPFFSLSAGPRDDVLSFNLHLIERNRLLIRRRYENEKPSITPFFLPPPPPLPL